MPFNHNKENSAYFHKRFSKKKYLYRQKWTASFATTSKSLYFREMLSVFDQCFEELWKLLCLRYSITQYREPFKFPETFFRNWISLEIKEQFNVYWGTKIAHFPRFVVGFWSMFWVTLETCMLLVFNHNIKHLLIFQKRFSETKYLK